MAQAQISTTHNPVERIQAMLEAEKRPPPDPKKAAEPVIEKVEPQPETPPETPAAENAQIEGAEARPDEAAEEIPEDRLEAIELEVKEWSKDGQRKPSKRTIKELREGYMRLDDYSRNIQEVARQRDEVPEKIRQGIEGERKIYQENLTQLNNLVLSAAAQELQGVNWNDLAVNDPAKYVQLRNRADQFNQALATIKNKQVEVEARVKQEQGESLKKAARESRARLEAEIPNWSDDLYKKVMKAGEPFGFKTEEVAEWIDPRAIKVLHALYEYQQLKPGNPQDKKVVVPPKVVKPGAAQTDTPASKKAEEASKRLRSSGRIEDAAAVIASRM